QEHIRLLRRLNGEVDQVRQTWRHALERRDAQSGRVGELDAACQASAQAVKTVVGALSAGYRSWHASLIHLLAQSPQEMAMKIGEWGEAEFTFPSPVQLEIERARHAFHQQIAAERAAAHAQRNLHHEMLETLSKERADLLEGRHQPPRQPY